MYNKNEGKSLGIKGNMYEESKENAAKMRGRHLLFK